jgi:hypothetical protein
MEKFKTVLTKISTTGVVWVGYFIYVFVVTIEVLFSTVSGLAGVINDNINRIKNLFDGKSDGS